MNGHGIYRSKRANELVKMGINSIEELRKNKEYLNDKQKIGLQQYEELIQKIPHKEIVDHERHLKTFLKKTDSSAELTITGQHLKTKERKWRY